MVFHGLPQGPGSISIQANANNPPQGPPGSGELTFDDEDCVILAIRSSVEFVIALDRNSVDFQVTI